MFRTSKGEMIVAFVVGGIVGLMGATVSEHLYALVAPGSVLAVLAWRHARTRGGTS